MPHVQFAGRQCEAIVVDRVSHIQDAGRDLVVWSSLVSLAIETGWMGHVERRDHVKKKGPKEEHKKTISA